MKTVNFEEAISRMTAGEQVTLYIPQNMGSMTMEAIVKQMNNGAIFAIANDAEEVSAQDEQPKEEKPKKKRTPVDTGKLFALYQAGWSAPKIADELGISDQTVYNYLRKRGVS